MKAGQVKLELQKLLLIPESKRAMNIGQLTTAQFERLKNTPNDAEWTNDEPVGKGVKRTDWKGFTPVDPKKLTALLPTAAKHLGPVFVSAGQDFGLHPLFLVAISKHETGNWTSNAFRNLKNAMGISDVKGVIAQPSHEASIRRMANSLTRQGGYYSKAKTLADVGNVYAPVGAANDPTKVNSYWPGLVSKYMAEYEAKLT